MRNRLIAAAIMLLCFPFGLSAQVEQNNETTTLLGELIPLRDNFDVQFYNLSLVVDINNKHIAGENTIVFQAKNDIQKIQIDLYDNMKVESIMQHNKPLQYERKEHSIFIDLENTVKKGLEDSITISYSGKPIEAKNAPWDGGFVWTTDSLGQPWVAVAVESKGASLWWPNKDHLSDEPDKGIQFSINVPENLKAVSNGRMIGKENQEDGTTTYIWRTSYPIDNYNVTMYIGDYVTYKTYYEGIPATVNKKGGFDQAKPRSLDVDYYMLSYHIDKSKQHFTFVDDVLSTFEFAFGPYPFYRDGFGIVEAPYLGMEHQGAIAYGNEFKMGWQGKLVKPYIEFDYLFVHETAHEWWGNNISVADRADMWIQEGFATYADAIYVVSMYGYKAYLEYMDYYKSLVKNQEPIQGIYGQNASISSDSYYKTALMLNTLSQLVENNDDWLSALRKMQEKFKAPHTTNSEEVRQFLEDELRMELTPFFTQYLETNKIPKLVMRIYKDKGKEYLVYRWQNVVEGFEMPVQLQYEKFEQKWIYPTQEWKKVELPKEADKNKLTVDDRLFYIDFDFEK